MRNVPPPDTRLVCTQPFSWFEIHPDGSVFLCCPAWLKTSVGNLLHTPLQAIWNGDKARGIRKAILDGSFSCCNRKRCPRLPSASAPVMTAAQIPDDAIRRVVLDRETVLPYGPKVLNLCVDRSCNLACPSCRQEPFVASGVEDATVRTLMERILVEAAPGAEKLILSGTGDPFGSPGFRHLLRSFDPAAFPHLRTIHLHSNGQLWDPSMWASMPGIHPYVRTAEISVDAADAPTYALNRRGGNFERLCDNLAFIATLPIDLTLSFVVQANNYRQLPAFVELARRYGARVYVSQLVNWGTFSRQEFRLRAVHLPEHPEHGAFRERLSGIALEPGVDVGNLHPLLEGADPTGIAP